MTHLWASKQERRAPANQKAPESEKGSEASRGKLGGDPEKGRRNQSKEKPYWVVHFSLWKRPSLGSFPPGSAGQGPTLHVGHLGPEGQRELAEVGKLGSRSGRWISTAFADSPAYFSEAADRSRVRT